MARVKLLTEADQPEAAELVAEIRGARRSTLINVYRLLLHAPALARTWFEHINAVRWKTSLPGRLREIVIIRIGHLTGVGYIVNQHVRNLAEAEGLPKVECAALDAPDAASSPFFSPAEQAALHFTDEMTRDIQVTDTTFAAVREHFSEAETVELSVLIGTYNMHARVLCALQIDPEAVPDAKAPKS